MSHLTWLSVSPLMDTVNDKLIYQHFGQSNKKLKYARVMKTEDGESKGYGYLAFSDMDGAKTAQQSSYKMLDGEPVYFQLLMHPPADIPEYELPEEVPKYSLNNNKASGEESDDLLGHDEDEDVFSKNWDDNVAQQKKRVSELTNFFDEDPILSQPKANSNVDGNVEDEDDYFKEQKEFEERTKQKMSRLTDETEEDDFWSKSKNAQNQIVHDDEDDEDAHVNRKINDNFWNMNEKPVNLDPEPEPEPFIEKDEEYGMSNHDEDEEDAIIIPKSQKLQQENVKLQETVSRLQDDLILTKERLRKVEEDFSNQILDKKTLEKENSALKEQIIKISAEKSQLEKEISTNLSKNNSKIAPELTKISPDLTKLAAEKTILEKERNQFKEEIQKFIQERGIYEKERTFLKEELNKSKYERGNLEKDKMTLMDQIKKLEDDLKIKSMPVPIPAKKKGFF